MLGTAIHVPLTKGCLDYLPDTHAVEAIGMATSISSLIKLVLIVGIGQCHSDVRLTWTKPSVADAIKTDSASDFYQIGLPSMIMFCAEGWAFQILTLLAGLISVED